MQESPGSAHPHRHAVRSVVGSEVAAMSESDFDALLRQATPGVLLIEEVNESFGYFAFCARGRERERERERDLTSESERMSK